MHKSIFRPRSKKKKKDSTPLVRCKLSEADKEALRVKIAEGKVKKVKKL